MINWPTTPLTEALGIALPIIQAPMADGITTPELVAAVANAGGLGSLGAGHMQPEEMRQAVRAIRERTDKPFAVNLFAPQALAEDAERIIRANELLAPYRKELNLLPAEALTTYQSYYTEQLGVLFEESVPILSFDFGVPRPREIESLKQRGVKTIATATHLLEAIVLEESGIDVVVAQGFEAGGQRSTFLGSYQQGLVGIMALVPILVEHLAIPIVAAGGIMDGRSITAALALGASGVQMGTAFLPCVESGIHPQYKEKLIQGTEIDTMLTRVFSGRLGRGLKNRFTEELSEVEDFLPSYPALGALTEEIRQAAAAQDNAEFMALWMGQGAALSKSLPAAELIRQWQQQIATLLKLDQAAPTTLAN